MNSSMKINLSKTCSEKYWSNISVGIKWRILCNIDISLIFIAFNFSSCHDKTYNLGFMKYRYSLKPRTCLISYFIFVINLRTINITISIYIQLLRYKIIAYGFRCTNQNSRLKWQVEIKCCIVIEERWTILPDSLYLSSSF